MQVHIILKSWIVLILNYKLKILNLQSKKKLIDLFSELSDFKFVIALVLKVEKIQSDDRTLYSTFYPNSKAETIINESGIDDVFESISSIIISYIQKTQVGLLIQS